MESNHDSSQRTVTRRNALKALGAAGMSLAAIGPAAAKPDKASSEGEGKGKGDKGRPTVTLTSPRCAGIGATRDNTGPNEPIDFRLESDDGASRSFSLDRGESYVFEYRPNSVWRVVESHPSIAVEGEPLLAPC